MKNHHGTHYGTQNSRSSTGEGGLLSGSRSGPPRYIQARKIFRKGEGIVPAADSPRWVLKRLAKKKRGAAGVAGRQPGNDHPHRPAFRPAHRAKGTEAAQRLTSHTTPMKTFLGTKLIKARPMTRGEYNAHRGWTPPEGEDQTVLGYLVEYQDGGKPNHAEHVGYISWSPADVFEKAYQEIGEVPTHLKPHEQRVFMELEELNIRIRKLGEFINNNPAFKTLTSSERWNLERQHTGILNIRLKAFVEASPPAASGD